MGHYFPFGVGIDCQRKPLTTMLGYGLRHQHRVFYRSGVDQYPGYSNSYGPIDVFHGANTTTVLYENREFAELFDQWPVVNGVFIVRGINVYNMNSFCVLLDPVLSASDRLGQFGESRIAFCVLGKIIRLTTLEMQGRKDQKITVVRSGCLDVNFSLVA